MNVAKAKAPIRRRRKPSIPKPPPTWKPTELYQVKCGELADSFGYEAGDVWFWFCQIAWCIQGCSIFTDRAVAECTAYNCVVAIFDKRGAQAS